MALLVGWLALILSLVPRSVHATSQNVVLNGTTIVGAPKRFTDNITVEFFGGMSLDKGFVAKMGSLICCGRFRRNSFRETARRGAALRAARTDR